MSKHSCLKLSISLLIASPLMSDPVLAQREISTSIEEVVVTAQKREENLSDVPMAVSALDGKALDRTIARDLQDIQDMSPNIMIDPILGNGTISFMSRGINMDDVEQSFDPAVGVVIDGLHLGTATGSLMSLWDVQQVEMLRGPQGTLFGKNTIGGVLNITRSRPTGELGGKVAMTIGEWDRRDVKGVLNLPSMLNDTLSAKLSFVRLDGGGYFNNIVRGEQEGDEDYVGGGITLLWEPSDSLEVLFSHYIDRSDTPTRPVTSLSVTQSGNADAASIAGGQPACLFDPASCDHPYTESDWHRDTRTTFAQPASLDIDTTILNIAWDVSDDHRLVSITGWREFDETAIQEFDGYEFDLFWTNRPQTNEQFSQELRLESQWNDSFKSIFGLYLWEREYEINQQTYFTPLFFGLPPGPAFEVANGFDQIQETESWSVFGQVDWAITDAMTLSIGGRYLDEEKDTCGGIGVGPQDARIYDPTIVPGTGLYGNCAGRRPAAAVANSSNQWTDFVNGGLVEQTGKLSVTNFSPRVALSYQFDDGALLYGSYTEGFRSGGFNGRSTNAYDHGPYDPEEVSSIEVGYKTVLLDQRMSLNIAAFFTTYDDKQEEVVFPALGGAGTVTIVENVEEAQINGLEVEMSFIATDGLTFNASFGYLDASFEDYQIPFLSGSCTVFDPCTQVGVIDKSHFELRRAPETNFTLGALYEVEMGAGNFFIGKINYRWRDDYHTTTNNAAEGFVEAFGMLDASIHFEFGDSWRLSLYGKNLTDEDYLLHALDPGTSFVPANTLPAGVAPSGYTGNQAVRVYPGTWSFGTVNPPRNFGVEVQYTF